MHKKKVILVIMDGWGLNEDKYLNNNSAIYLANTPFIDYCYSNYPNSKLYTHGEYVGLPNGQMGNSEVGHTNLGAGRVVLQDLMYINNYIKTINNPLYNILRNIQLKKNNLHLVGLLSDGGVHSHIDHLKYIILICYELNLKNVFIHIILDGRDCYEKSSISFLKDIMEYTKDKTGIICSIIGRYYAMDRDNRWDRTNIFYNLLVNSIGCKVEHHELLCKINDFYKKNITDEFIPPILVNNNYKCINDINNSIIFFNYRSDRMKQITSIFLNGNKKLGIKSLSNLEYYSFTEYLESSNIKVIFRKKKLINTIGEVLSKNNITQARIAETEKYPHVTYFFNGGIEQPFEKEIRIMCKSVTHVKTYNYAPSMSAYSILNKVKLQINKGIDFICINFANPDMVGHTGDLKATIKAVETVDNCVSKISKFALLKDYSLFITSDHGNAEFMINKDGTRNTSHTLNRVPFIFLNNYRNFNINNGILADVSPTILNFMGIDIPADMTGNILFN